MTPSGVYKNQERSETPRVGALGFRVPHDVECRVPWNRNLAAGEMAPADMAVPMPALAPVSLVVEAAAQVDRAASRLCIWRSDVQKYGYSMNCLGCRSVMTGTTARAHTDSCRRRLEERTEQKSGRKEHSFVLTAGWRVESNQQTNLREVVRLSHTRRVELRAALHWRLQQAAQRLRLHHAVRQELNNSKVTKFQTMVSREKGGRHKFKTRVSWTRVNRVSDFKG